MMTNARNWFTPTDSSAAAMECAATPDQHPGRGQHGVGHIVQLVGCDLRLDQNLSTIMCTVWSNSRTGAMGNPKPVASQR